MGSLSSSTLHLPPLLGSHCEMDRVTARRGIGLCCVDPPGVGVPAIDRVHVGYPNKLGRDAATDEMRFAGYEYGFGIDSPDAVDQLGDGRCTSRRSVEVSAGL